MKDLIISILQCQDNDSGLTTMIKYCTDSDGLIFPWINSFSEWCSELSKRNRKAYEEFRDKFYKCKTNENSRKMYDEMKKILAPS